MIMGASHVRDIIIDNYGSTGSGGDTPTAITTSNFGQGSRGTTSYNRYEFYDESIGIFPAMQEFKLRGIEQYLEQDVEVYEIVVAVIDDLELGQDRYKAIVQEIRRIALNFKGNSYYSRLHFDMMKQEEHMFYIIGRGQFTAYLTMTQVNSG